MSKKRTPARSSNAAATSSSFGGFGSPSTFSPAASQLSYVTEPPDLSHVSDGNLVVLFKNLLKKDDTTKAKALEDLQNTLSNSADIEEPVLTAWIRLYPRLSTDTSRRVRHLAHIAHGVVSQRAGKKIARHMPKVVGAWLSGLYDSDRATARAARDALGLVFATEDKVNGVWRHYHGGILEHCTNVIANESTGSLSDERQVSPDDAEAKFVRVIACCVLTVGHLISELPEEYLVKQDAAYGALFANPHFWAFTHHLDPFLRKALYKFLQVTLHKRADLVSSNLEIVANALLVEAVATAQIGSVTNLLDALLDLTRALPAAWTTVTPPKQRTAISLVQRFVVRGSQNAGPEYWIKLANLLSALPAEILPMTAPTAKDLLHAIVDGIRSGPEPRSHLVAAWGVYFSTCYKLLSLAEEEDAELTRYVLDDAVYPIYTEYLLAADPASRIALPHYAAVICASGIAMAGVQSARTVALVNTHVWQPAKDVVLRGVKAEGATCGKDVGQRWVELSAEILRRTRPENPVVEMVRASNVDVVVACMESIVADSAERSHVAGLLENVLAHFGDAVELTTTTLFFAETVPALLASPSLPQLLGALVAYGTHTGDTAAFQAVWKKTVQALLLSALSKERKEAAITQLLKLTPPSSGLLGKVPCVHELERYVANKLQSSLDTDEAPGWEMAKAAFRSVAVSADTTMAMLVTLTAGLAPTQEERAAKVCVHLGAVAKQDPAVLTSFVRSEHGADLLSRLLVLTESPDDAVSAAARTVNRALEQGLASSSTTKAQADRVVGDFVDIISRSVREPEDVELSLHTLAEKARDLINRAPESERAGLAERLLFTEEHWRPALRPFLRCVRNVSLAITNVVGGCVFLVVDDVAGDGADTELVVRDGQGVGSALRMGVFTVEFLKAVGVFDRSAADIFSGVSEEAKVNLFFYLTLALEIAKDNIGIGGANDLWTGCSAEVEVEVEEFVSDAQLFILNWLKEGELAVYLAVDRLMGASLQQNATGFYAARVLARLIADLTEYQRTSVERAQGWIKSVNVRKDTDVFRCAAILTGLAESLEHSKDADRLRNELASDLTGVPVANAGEEGLRKLIYLNAVLPKLREEAAPLLPQRAIFLVKHLLAWFEDEEFTVDPNLAVIAEAAKVFASVLPAVKSLYGEHWQTLCDFVVNCWQMCCVQMGEQDIPVTFATLKLFQTLRSLRKENDDIEDAWNNSLVPLYSGLTDLLRSSQQTDEQHQPRNLCNALMARQTKTMDLKYLEGPSEIYPLLNVRSRPIQEAAFEILHRHIPSVQEQVSIDAAFSREETFQLQLPAELLSLVLEPPTMSSVEGLSFARGMPLVLRGYLLTWILIFDHFENSSFKVKSAYIENLKEGGYLTGLLDFAFDFLGHAKGRPIDASKFQIEEYTLDSEDNPEKDTQWLLIHLYYLSLRFTPSLAKAWWIDCKSRQKVLSVEKFTEKYMSPLIIDKELQSVRTWIQERPAPVPGEEDKEMQVRISRGATKEVTAVYPIDDQTMEMVVRLPLTFPLRQVEVEGVKRVGLNEQQFRKMQLASQAVINFQSASIIDGLTLFHKNIQLHFNGVAECAICYSILAVTPDRALPNKACSTCKHKFHSTCLLKWFKTSNSSSCPLCRTSFSFYS